MCMRPQAYSSEFTKETKVRVWRGGAAARSTGCSLLSGGRDGGERGVQNGYVLIKDISYGPKGVWSTTEYVESTQPDST